MKKLVEYMLDILVLDMLVLVISGLLSNYLIRFF